MAKDPYERLRSLLHWQRAPMPNVMTGHPPEYKPDEIVAQFGLPPNLLADDPAELNFSAAVQSEPRLRKRKRK